MIIPSVLYKGDTSPQILDVFSRLLRDRAIMLSGEINDQMSDIIVAQLFHLESEDPESDISMYINSPGGSVTSALAIYDVMQYIKPKVNTICIGQACSAASFILCAGNRRFMTQHARLLLHQPSGSVSGQASDLRIQAAEINRMYNMIKDIYQKHTRMEESQVISFLDRDTILIPEQCKELGIVDDILLSRKSDVTNNNIVEMAVSTKSKSKKKD